MHDVTCVLCGETVSKRKSLAYGDGRACRKHDEVMKMVNDHKLAERMNLLNEQMQIETITSFVRVNELLHGTPFMVSLGIFGQKYPKNIMDKARERVYAVGKMTAEEASESLSVFLMEFMGVRK